MLRAIQRVSGKNALCLPRPCGRSRRGLAARHEPRLFDGRVLGSRHFPYLSRNFQLTPPHAPANRRRQGHRNLRPPLTLCRLTSPTQTKTPRPTKILTSTPTITKSLRPNQTQSHSQTRASILTPPIPGMPPSQSPTLRRNRHECWHRTELLQSAVALRQATGRC